MIKFVIAILGTLLCMTVFAQEVPVVASAASSASVLSELPSAEISPVLDPTFVPPEWLQKAVLIVKELPLVGPIVVEILKYLGVLAAILTALTACALAILKSLKLVLKLVKLDSYIAKIEAIENSKVLYYLKFLSNFNAQKKS